MSDEEYGDYEVLDGNGTTEGGEHEPPAKRLKATGVKRKYALPTPEEAAQLLGLDSGSSSLLAGNLLRLEVNELLEEVRVNYDKKSCKSAEAWLFKLKDALEGLQPATVTAASLSDLQDCIRLSAHAADKPVTLEFAPPASVDIVGSYLLQALVKPSLNIDVALALPPACLHPRDFVSHRYFDKRALYVGHIAQQLTALARAGALAAASIRVCPFKGDPRKPCILVRPFVTGAAAAMTIRLLPALGTDVIAPVKLAPHRSNVRRRRERAADAPPPPTPCYNAAVLEDMAMARHLAALHAASAASPGLRDAIMLAKVTAELPPQRVWLGQRGHRTADDGLDGYCAGMVLLHLLQTRAVGARMGALQLFQALIKFLGGGGLSGGAWGGKGGAQKCRVVRCTEEDPEELTPEQDAVFRHAYTAVLVDTGLGFNILARVSAEALAELEADARDTLDLLQRGGGGGARAAGSGGGGSARTGSAAFSALFLTRASFWRRYDAFVRIPVHPRGGGGGGNVAAEDAAAAAARADAEEDALCDAPPRAALAARAAPLLRRALGDRAAAARPLRGASAEDAADFAGAPGTAHAASRDLLATSSSAQAAAAAAAEAQEEELVVGLLLNAESAARAVDRGPSAEDAAAAAAFRAFWGARAELRRFKDGAIVEAVVWGGGGGGGGGARPREGAVVEEVVRHALARHEPERCGGGGSGSENGSSSGGGSGGVRFAGHADVHRLIAASGYSDGGGAENGDGGGGGGGSGGGAVTLASVGAALPAAAAADPDDALTRLAVAAYDALAAKLRALEGLPLRVDAVAAAAPALRFTAALPPLPHALAAGAGEEVPLWGGSARGRRGGGGGGGIKRVTSQVPVLPLVVRFERSSKWPKEAGAVQHTIAAFLLRVSQCLEAQHEVPSRVVTPQGGARGEGEGEGEGDGGCEGVALDVFTGGYCFRLRVRNDVEAIALKEAAAKGDADAGAAVDALERDLMTAPLHHTTYFFTHNTLTPTYDTDAAAAVDALERDLVTAPLHHALVAGFHARHRAFGPTARAAQRWVHAHMLSDHVLVEAVELIAAALWTQASGTHRGGVMDAGWVHAHMLSDHVPVEAMELIAAALWTQAVELIAAALWTAGRPVELVAASLWTQASPLPPPSTALSGLLRFLLLLARHDWAAAPLVVDFHGELSPADHAAAAEACDARARARRRWTPTWTRADPEAPVLGRLRALAAASADAMLRWLRTGGGGSGDGGIDALFALAPGEAAGFAARIRTAAALRPCGGGGGGGGGGSVMSGEELLARTAARGARALRAPRAYRNVALGSGGGSSGAAAALHAGLDPVAQLVRELRRRFGHLALFLRDALAGGSVAVVWRPAAFLPAPLAPLAARYAAPAVAGGGGGGAAAAAAAAALPVDALAVPNVAQVLAEMRAVAGDMADAVVPYW
ncbi:Nrap protein-domain-containing protein [Tribonema minus]|uniref:Nrap protein-domain-containing protein n=1 Tax=Tribonema minus TaxID=303371 RepID=A0A836CBT1_9STRA|nr:Nrap protein-domain-containing protein [Tribonema minus]